MHKTLLKISGIILGNLLAFSLIWLILDALFEAEWAILLASVLISLPFLWLIMYFKAWKILQDIHTISITNDDRESNK
jgi:ABC-type spermidine/putrescine transport system permease subunit I